MPWIFRYFGFLIALCFTRFLLVLYSFVTYSWRQCTTPILSPGTVPSRHSLQHFPTSVVFFQSSTWTSHWLKVITGLENRWSVEGWTFATHWALTPAYLLHLSTTAQSLLKIFYPSDLGLATGSVNVSVKEVSFLPFYSGCTFWGLWMAINSTCLDCKRHYERVEMLLQ